VPVCTKTRSGEVDHDGALRASLARPRRPAATVPLRDAMEIAHEAPGLRSQLHRPDSADRRSS
jgi:hypothetical protein